MSRRKDKERIEAMKRVDPEYKGFRGYDSEPIRAGRTQMEAINCTVCGRKRNVATGIAMQQRNSFICSSCLEEGATAKAEEPSEA